MNEENKYPLDEAFKDAFEGYEAEFTPADMQADWQGVQSQLGTGAAAGAGVSAGTIISSIAGFVAVAGLIAYLVLTDAGTSTKDTETVAQTEQVLPAGEEKVHKAGEGISNNENPEHILKEEKAGKPEIKQPESKPEGKVGESRTLGKGTPVKVPDAGSPQKSSQNIEGATTAGKNDAPGNNGPFVQFSALSACAGTAITVTVAETAQGDVYYVTDNGRNLPVQHTYILLYDKAGIHRPVFVHAKNDGGHDTIAPLVTINHSPKAAFGHQVKNISQAIFYNRCEGALLYRWDFGDNNFASEAAPTHTYNDTGEFNVRLIAVNSFGCTDTAVAGVKITGEIYLKPIPNTFTPNNDGYNDYFEIPIKGETYFDLAVMDMNNKIVFRSNSKDNMWDGTDINSGKPVQPSQYIFVLHYKLLGNNKVMRKTGTITLIRD